VIAVINESTVVSDNDVASYVDAYQTQINRDFSPKWGLVTTLDIFTRATAPANAWQVVFLDTSDQAGAAGYHDVTNNGYPLAKVFAETTLAAGMSVSVDGSHEILEALGDPEINRAVTNFDDSGNVTSLYAYENCDPCEDDQYGYDINGVLVSDFVFPTWFGGIAASAYDFGGHITAPGQILINGYIGVWTPQGGWVQQTNAEDTRNSDWNAIPVVGSRFERRRRTTSKWIASNVQGTPAPITST
jgi:hypothetical protein